MLKVSRVAKGYKIGFVLTLGAIAALFAPHFVDYLYSRSSRDSPLPRLAGSRAPEGAVAMVSPSIDTNDLFNKLEEADQQWLPQEELLPNGSTRYLYKRRSGEPELSIAALRSLINDPPTFQREREAINELLQTLRQSGVKVMFTPTIKKGAAAEWDHREGVLRMQPHLTGKGSLDFMRVLNHEAIHVAQSCHAGSLLSRPVSLGIPVSKSTTLVKTLSDPIYADASNWERQLEAESYGMQNQIGRANELVRIHCKPKQTARLY